MPLKFFYTFVFVAVFATAAPAYANTQSFSQIPILHEGRIKPMDSFACAQLKQFSGRDTQAIPWLIETIFNPALAEMRPVLKIGNPDLINLLELDKHKDRLFSYKEISQALGRKQDIILSIIQTPEEQWTQAQHDIILLQQNTVLLGDLLNSLSLFLPLSVTLPDNAPDNFKPYTGKLLTYLDTLKFHAALQDKTQQIVQEKGENIERYTAPEAALSYLAFAAENLSQSGARSHVFRIIPGAGSTLFLSPWDILNSGAGSPETSVLFQYWKDMALAYHMQDQNAWQTAAKKAYEETIKLSRKNIRPTALHTERLYNIINPFQISIAFYSFSLLLLIGARHCPGFNLINFALLSLYSGMLFHLAGIATRIYILQRPPVSTLYESILFVGLIAVLYGLLAYRRQHDRFWLFLSASLGVLLHMLGFSHDQDGDNLLMLTAVLNTNFWLATHVICITTGYALCIVTSVLAHHALIKTLATAQSSPPSKLFENIHMAALLALLFAATGTLLGGIWADQSWGRFWGWDPKENGALLIVLWLIWLIHGRISGQMNILHTTAGLAFLSVIVALSWFGVNLLGIGLHAYGFTDFAAWILALLIGAEVLFIGYNLYKIPKR